MANAIISTSQVIYDGGERARVLLNGYANGIISTNTIVVKANSLQFANLSQPCIITVEEIIFTISGTVGGGFAELQYAANTSNTSNAPIWLFSPYAGSGQIDMWIPNPLVPQASGVNFVGKTLLGANNLALVANQWGDINLWINNFGANDAYSMIITVRKQFGYANAEVAYEAGHPAVGY